METAITVVHVVLTGALIGLVLVQRGKGADVGAAFGSGASNTMFGSQGSASFLTRTTAVLAACFFITSLTLAYMGAHRDDRRSVTEIMDAPAVVQESVETVRDVPVFPDEVVPADGQDVPVISE